jgi:hypothetical protein
MKKTFILSILFVFYLTLSFSVGAVSPTPEASESAVQEIRDKVKEIVREKIEETQKGQKAAFFGEIGKITEEALTLQTTQGEKQLKIATDTAFIGKGNKKITLDDLKAGSFAIAMGFLEDNNSLQTKRLVISEKTQTAARETAFGKITDISSEEKVLTIKNEAKNMIYTVEINDKTIINKRVDGKIQKIKFEAIAKGDQIITVGAPSENEHKIITAKIVQVISNGVQEEAEPTATPSAKTTPANE